LRVACVLLACGAICESAGGLWRGLREGVCGAIWQRLLFIVFLKHARYFCHYVAHIQFGQLFLAV
jgi:hypothetical protein